MNSLLLAALIAAGPASLCRAQRPVPVPSVKLDAQGLARLFDGNRAAAADPVVAVGASAAPPSGKGRTSPSEDDRPRPDAYVIRAEDDPLPKAPRFALNLGAVPRHLRSMIEGFKSIFHKNQEETEEWVEKMNLLIRAKNASGAEIPEWTYDGRPNEPPWTCLAHAAATVNDWWAMQLGRELPSHRSLSHGGLEKGMDPAMLELKYFERTGFLDSHYFLLPKFIEEDPVRHLAIPQQPRGFAELLIENAPYEVTDPVTDQVHRWTPDQSAMDGQYLELFTGNILLPRTSDKYARVLAQAIDKWGIAMVQMEDTKRPRLTGAHTVGVVGYFCMEDGGLTPDKLIPCAADRSDKEWGRTTWFVVHDSFGDFPADKPRDARGAAAYRAVRISSIDQAIVFPHGLKVFARPQDAGAGTWRVSVTNKAGRPVDVLVLKASRDGEEALPAERDGRDGFVVRPPTRTTPAFADILLYVEARHYYEADGKGRVFRLNLGAGPSEGVEVVRTPKTPTYRERMDSYNAP